MPSSSSSSSPSTRLISSKSTLASPTKFQSLPILPSTSKSSSSSQSTTQSRKGKEKASLDQSGEELINELVAKEFNNEDNDSFILSIEEEEEEDSFRRDSHFDQIGLKESKVIGVGEGEHAADLLRKQLRSTSLQRGKYSEIESIPIPTEDPTLTRTIWKPRRYFILSRAGKLIYTSEESEDAAVHAGIISAVVGIFTDESDVLQSISAPPMEISFLVKSPIYLVVISDWGEPKFVLRAQLEYLYLNILTILTKSQLTNIFKKRENFDLRRLLEGTDANFSTLIDTLQTSIPILTNSLEIQRLSASTRAEIGKVLVPPKKIPQHLYTLLLSPCLQLISILRPKSHSIHPSDLSLLLSFLKSSKTSMMESEANWIPFCLPGFRSDGFLWIYVEYKSLSDSLNPIGLVIISAEKDNFEFCKLESQRIWFNLESKLLMSGMNESMKDYSIEELNLPGLRHFFFKSKIYGQVLKSNWSSDYKSNESRYELILFYQKLHEIINSKFNQSESKLIQIKSIHYSILAWSTTKFELYLIASPFLNKNQLINITKLIQKFIEKKEKGEIWLIDAPTF